MIFKATITPDFFSSDSFTTNESLKKIALEFTKNDCTITSISQKKVLDSKNKINYIYFVTFRSTEHFGILKMLIAFKERVTFHEIEELN